jgi:hypothetical protein
VDLQFLLTHGTRNGEHRNKIKEEGELSSLGFQYEFLFGGSVGAAEQNPYEQRVGETPLIGEEHLSIRGGQTSYGEYHFFYSG